MATVAHPKSRFVLAVTFYVAALCLVLAAFVLGSILNPKGIYGLSWFDPLERPLMVVSFAMCVLASFLTPAGNRQRLFLIVGGMLGFAAAIVIGFILSVLISGPLPG